MAQGAYQEDIARIQDSSGFVSVTYEEREGRKLVGLHGGDEHVVNFVRLELSKGEATRLAAQITSVAQKIRETGESSTDKGLREVLVFRARGGVFKITVASGRHPSVTFTDQHVIDYVWIGLDLLEIERIAQALSDGAARL
jgi:hypothetical protein